MRTCTPASAPAVLLRGAAIALALVAVAPPAAAQAVPPLPAMPGTVTLPLSEYDRLVERGLRPVVPPAVAPVAAAVTSAEMRLRASAGDLRGTISVLGDVLRAGTTKVPLVSGGTLLDAQQGGASVPIVSDGAVTSVILSGPASFALTLTWAADVTTEPGRASATLPYVRAAMVRATIDAPGENADVRVESGLVSSRTTSAGRTVVDITLETGTAPRLTWSSRDHAPAPAREVRLATDVKTLITVAEAEVRMASLFDVTTVDGEPGRLALRLPDGFDVVNLTGTSVESPTRQGSTLVLGLPEGSARRRQFLLTLERPFESGVGHAEFAVPTVEGSTRETGEVAWEGAGTVDLSATERAPLHRLDVTEVSAPLMALSRSPLLSAFRYQRRQGDPVVGVQFDVRRFPDAAVLPALGERAVATTLMTSEGRLLTEVNLQVRNRGQLFLKVGLPAGAALLSSEVGGQPVKPVEGADGTRVPLVRPGFNPTGGYVVSFVYVSSGDPLGRKGAAEVRLPRLDLPVGVLEWEVFLPERYQVKKFEGDLIPRDLLPAAVPAAGAVAVEGGMAGGVAGGVVGFLPRPMPARLQNLTADQVGGRVVDAAGGVVPGVTISVVQGSQRQTAVTDAEGAFVVSGVQPGPVAITGDLQGFVPMSAAVPAGARRPVTLVARVAALEEKVTVTAEAPPVQQRAQANNAPSENVLNLQRRVAGVLPVRIDIPRAGRSYLFVRPVVLDEETTLRFEYKTR